MENKQNSDGSTLTHYGVKGMKWGVRRAERNAPNSGYTTGMKSKDIREYGKGGVKRINRRMNKGATATKARKKERSFQRRRTAAIVGGLVVVKNAKQVGAFLRVFGDIAAVAIADRAEAKRGEAFSRNSFAESNGLRGTPKTSRRRRDGSYNISSMGR